MLDAQGKVGRVLPAAESVEWVVSALLLLVVFILSALIRRSRADREVLEELIQRSRSQANLLDAAATAIVLEAGKLAKGLRELSTELRTAGQHLAAAWRDKSRKEGALAAMKSAFEKIDTFILVHSAIFAALGLERHYFEYSLHATGMAAEGRPGLQAPTQ